MNRVFLSFCLISFLSISFISCNTSSKKQLSEGQVDSVRTNFKIVQDSLQYAWNMMIEDDDLKIADIKRLLDEMQNSDQYDTSRLDSLKTDLQNLAASRYDIKSMAVSENIDAYDYSTSDLINKVLIYAQTKPAYQEYTLMGTLESDISEAQERVLYYRINYDNWAKIVNLYLDQNREYLDSPTASLLPLFELSE